MLNFPKLSSGAISQYPTVQQTTALTNVMKFIDGSEQRFASSGKGLQAWQVSYELLNEQEFASIISFIQSTQAGTQAFAFRDPRTGITHNCCRLDLHQFKALYREGRSSLRLLIREDVE